MRAAKNIKIPKHISTIPEKHTLFRTQFRTIQKHVGSIPLPIFLPRFQ